VAAEPEPESDPELEEAVADLKAAPEPAPLLHPAEAAPTIGPPAARPPRPGPQAGASAAAGSGEEAGERRPIRRVVVDAGHGGLDPGAIGPSGVREKDVTLAMSKKLQRLLLKAGFEVIMTRSDDRYASLEDRTALANSRHGDLFISIHANAGRQRSLAGVETWVLNVSDDRYARRLAARENGANPELDGEGPDARRILTDLDAKAATGASRVLALAVQRDVVGSVRERIGDVQDLGVKSALFYVLLGARMPAVLVETGFISNRLEEQRLASPRYQDEVAGAVARAIIDFAAQPPRLARAE
jgi:N-acetylmuramoyl-L-alanine amidase